MQYKHYPVHPALQNWIRYFWSYDVYTEEVQELHVRSFADRYPRLIFQDAHFSSFIKENNGNIKPICYLSGIDTVPTQTFWESRFSHFGISFYPHSLNVFFGIDAAELTDKTPDIQLLEKEKLTEMLINVSSHEERVSVLHHYFFQKINNQKVDLIIENIFNENRIYHLDNEIKLASVAKHYQISERQLQRRFKHCVGISARKFSRLSKFEKALQILSTANYGNLTSIGYEIGYADQSHFIHDFKLFSGISPYDFARNNTLGSESSSFIYVKERE